MNNNGCIVVLLLAILSVMSVSVWGAAEGEEVLWQIGKADNDTGEFALGKGGWGDYSKRFPGDCQFTVGLSSEQRDWPYVLPGPMDAWAGGKEHTFAVVFPLEKTVAGGDCRVVIDLADTHSSNPPVLKICVNGHAYEKQMPKGAGDHSINGNPAAGREERVSFDMPAAELVKGENRLEITSRAGSWVLFDCITMETPAGVVLAKPKPETKLLEVRAEPVLVRGKDGGMLQPVVMKVQRIGEAIEVKAGIEGGKMAGKRLASGEQEVEVLAPAVEKETKVRAVLEEAGQVVGQEVVLKPVRKWEVHLVHQTHLDIGYTHTQEEVLRIQVEHLRKALQYIDDTKDYPEEARFVWHPEGMWAVEEFMRTAGEEEKARFVAAARAGSIHMDALYAQAMSGIYTEEELMELMASAKRFEKEYGVQIDSIMQSDVPGYTWGLVSALAQNGVRYMSVGPNAGHRIGWTFEWGDKPFYWVSPSGEHKVLFWMPSTGYSWFHGNPVGHRIEKGKILDYLDRLERQGYPYDLVMVRYNIGGDNGPPNPALCDFVKEWNEKYAYPKMIVARNSGAMKRLEERYGDRLPVVKGDFTPYWEDGAASTAADKALDRRACDKLVQAQTLWAMFDRGRYPAERFDQAWTNLIMYDEHTWGAWNSISEPEAPFVKQQAAYKQKFALEGARMTEELAAEAVEGESKAGSQVVDVMNTCSWPQTQLVILSPQQSGAGDKVVDEKGKAVASQRLGSGELAFVAREVPPFGVRRYSVVKGDGSKHGAAKATGLTIANDILLVEINPQSGAIQSLRCKGIAGDLVDGSQGQGINDYLYIIGRDPAQDNHRMEGPVKVTVEDAGPVVATLSIESAAPGCARLTRKVRIFEGGDTVELINIVDKKKELRPEGVYFAYPLQIPGGIARIDIPWAAEQPEKDQIPGANRNFYCVQRWVDISNEDYGLTWVTVDAPMLQFDPIKIAAAAVGAEQYRQRIEPGQTFYSWVMNNHWETNYAAYQEGICTFRYVLRPHASGYNQAEAQRTGRGVCNPLLVREADPSQPPTAPLLEVEGEGIVVTSLKPSRDGQAMMVRLFNSGNQQATVRLKWAKPPQETWLSNPMEDKISPSTKPLEMVPYQIVTLRVEP